MSQDYTGNKPATSGIWKPWQNDTSWKDLEPLVTPELVRSRHLFGIPLFSAMKDPLTGKRQAFTDDMLRDQIVGAVSDAELETHLDIFPRQYRERAPFDRQEYQAWSYFRTEHRPITSVERLTVRTSNEVDVFTVPLEWLEAGNLVKGQINLIPMGVALTGTGDPNSNGVVGGQTAGGAAFLAILGNQPWIAAFWMITYSTGFQDGNLPRPVNELVGIIAAMRVLSMLAATYARVTGASLGVDGLSQSVSGPGPQLFKLRMDELAAQRKLAVKKLRAMYATGLVSGNV